MIKTKYIIPFMLVLLVAGATNAQVYNVKDFGARPDGKTMNTQAIQTAIDKCSKTGGKVLIPKGIFMSGTLYLKSGVELSVDEGGVLKGSPYFKDYPDNHVNYVNAFTHNLRGISNTNKAFIFAEGVSNISLTGKGTINGSGDSPEFNLGNDDKPASKRRPCMLLIIDCKKIKVNDLLLTNSAYWMENYLGCDGLEIKRVRVINQSNYNQDGMDLDAKNVLVEDCTVDVDDDGICFKSHDPNRVPENIIVRNCNIGSNCNAIKFGTMSMGGLKNVNISNCNIHKASADNIRHWQQTLQFIGQPITVIAGIALEGVDGGVIDNINISNIKMNDVQTPIFIVLGNRRKKQMGGKDFYKTDAISNESKQTAGRVGNIFIKNVVATSYSKMASSITAFPGTYVENVRLQNIVFNTMGQGTLAEANAALKENPAAYPENRMYGQVYPASGFFIRHVKGLVIDGLDLKLREADSRPAIIMDDVFDSKINGLKAQSPADRTAVIRLIKSKNISINSPQIDKAHSPLLQLMQTNLNDVQVTGFKSYSGWISN